MKIKIKNQAGNWEEVLCDECGSNNWEWAYTDGDFRGYACTNCGESSQLFDLTEGGIRFFPTKEDIRDLLLTNDGEAIYQYYTASFGEKLGIYISPDGLTWYISPDVGMEIAEDERPIAILDCPGIGNIDTDFWVEGWTEENEDGTYTVLDTGEKIALGECIRRCCRDGDIEDVATEIIEKLWENMEDNHEKSQI